MKISVIIPAYNEEKLLPRCLEYVRQSAGTLTERGWESEVIVCDNNSTDRTAEVARSGGAIVVFEPINQIARARNTGAAAATGDWLVFIDADSFPSPELFRDLAARLAEPRWLGGGALVELDQEVGWFWRGWMRVWNLLSRTLRLAAGSFVVCRADAFRALGGFSLARFAGEEVDLFIRLKRLARERSLGIFILRKHRLKTSARKLTLYSNREVGRMLLRAVLRPHRFTASREACHYWYDGRR